MNQVSPNSDAEKLPLPSRDRPREGPHGAIVVETDDPTLPDISPPSPSPSPGVPGEGDKNAFTLLEVILALAILAGAVAVLGEIMAVAGRHTRESQAETRAQLFAASVMDQMLSGITQVASVSQQPLETTDTVPWVYSVNVSTTTITGLSQVEVIVEQDLEPQFNPVTYRLLRFYAPPPTPTATDATTGGGGVSG